MLAFKNKCLLLLILIVLCAAASNSQTINPDFGVPVNKMKGWTLVGKWNNSKTSQPNLKQGCLSIDGCGYAQSPKVQIKPGEKYLITGWGRTDDNWQNNSCIKIKWFDAQNKPVWWEFVCRDTFFKDWKKYEKIAIAPKNAKYASVVCHAQAEWGKKSFFAGVSFKPVKGPSLLWDMHIDHKDYHDWINDRSPYGTDGISYCLSLDDLMVSQAGGSINFENRRARVRFPQSKVFSYGEYDEWVMVLQFFLEEPVVPMDIVPEEAGYNIIGSPWNFSIAYIKNKQEKKLQATFYRYQKDGSSTNPYMTFPIEPWKWYRLTIIVNNKGNRIDGTLQVDGDKTSNGECGIIPGFFKDPSFVYIGYLDHPMGIANRPWGFWGRMDYIKIYDSIAAYKADEKNLVYGGFGKL